MSVVDGDISSKVQFAEEVAIAKENKPSRAKRIRIAIEEAGTRQAGWTKSVDNRGCGENTLALAEIYIYTPTCQVPMSSSQRGRYYFPWLPYILTLSYAWCAERKSGRTAESRL